MNGLCIQWGYATQNTDADKSITYPLQNQYTQTPSVSLSVGNSSNTRERWNYPVNIYGVSKNGFSLCSNSSMKGGAFYWIAIGY